jgi:hypothetical protein
MPVDPDLGYDPSDQFFYTPSLVRELLPMALDGPEPPAAGPVDPGRRGGDPAEAGNLQAMLLDVRRVYDRLPLNDQLTALAAHLNGTHTPAYVIDAIVERLGGGGKPC